MPCIFEEEKKKHFYKLQVIITSLASENLYVVLGKQTNKQTKNLSHLKKDGLLLKMPMGLSARG